MSRNYRVRKNSTRQPKVRHANRWPGLLPHQRATMAMLTRFDNNEAVALKKGAGKTHAHSEAEAFGLIYAMDQAAAHEAAHDDNFSLNC